MIYLTYAEPPTGVYSSQVIDVIKYLNLQGGKIKLVAFISLHEFKKNKLKILNEMPGAIVLPMLPKATYWQLNVISLFFVLLFMRSRNIIARNVIATNMALWIRKFGLTKKVCFDGRGAIAAEWKEYDVNVVDQWKKSIDRLEKKAVNDSDFRIAVTSQLVNYWIKNYGYSSASHVVIPCTVNSTFVLQNNLPAANNDNTNSDFHKDDIVFAYSGSTAGWQSFKTLESFIAPLLSADPHFKIIFLAQEEENINLLKKNFPQQVFQKWVAHHEVTKILAGCDYGILIREQTVTNQVAAPTKFAEYLSSGLPVVISPNLGDYSAFVETHRCGINLNGITPSIHKPGIEEKNRMIQLALQYFTKEANHQQYVRLLEMMK